MSNFPLWIPKYKKELIFGLIIFLVASISFGLGYLANREMTTTPIIIEKAGQ
ncbi:MAG: hypothetical protein Q7S28_03855 [bacterium]|nr:hypothetical protein [bacterium]